LPPATVAWARERLPGVTIESPPDREAAEKLLPEADVVLGWAVRPENFALAKKLRWIHVTAAGVTPLLFPALVESDVMLSNSRGLHADAMAEHALGMILSFARKLHLARDAQGARRWIQNELWGSDAPFRSLAGSTLGLVGLGAVGSAVATRAKALGMKVIAVRRRPGLGAGPADDAWGLDKLDDMLARSEWVVLTAPLTPESKGIIGAPQLTRMRNDAVLVNLGRGSLVDERALIAALERGEIAGAALDVTEEEPLPAASPLWAMPQVIVSPHVSGLGPYMWERAMAMFVEHVQAYQAGRPLPNLVDKRAGY
jgi:phosphoglycerate dehydrogenase-like enzyme